MSIVTNIDSFHSGLRPSFRYIHTMELAGPIFARGGFGEVYACLSINGATPASAQAVKILRDNGFGSARKGFEAIRKLQGKIRESNARRAASGQPGLESLPALRALPQFSFIGEMDGRQVLGYAADRLDTEGYVSLSAILDDYHEGYSPYERLSMEDRLLLATELVEGFQALAEMSFIHADINAPNLLVNVEDCHLAIIDYDSGAVTDRPDEQPTTFGKRDEWLAPEIKEQMVMQPTTGAAVRVDRFTDTWSVFIGIHHLLFLFHPLFFFSTYVTRESVESYLERYEWPEIAADDPLFLSGLEPLYRQFRGDLAALPAALVQKLKATMNDGHSDPRLRTSYQQWALVLRATQRGPEIAFFVADPETLVEGARTRLSWRVAGAHQVSIDQGIGAVDATGSIELSPSAGTTYTLSARARNGVSVTEYTSVRVWPIPVVRSVAVPTCHIYQQVSLRALPAAIPPIRLPIAIDLAVQVREPSLKRGAVEAVQAVHARTPRRFPRLAVRLGGQISALFDQLRSATTRS